MQEEALSGFSSAAYAYARNNPVTRFDPNGLASPEPGAEFKDMDCLMCGMHASSAANKCMAIGKSKQFCDSIYRNMNEVCWGKCKYKPVLLPLGDYVKSSIGAQCTQ